jgi:hypothetical protein
MQKITSSAGLKTAIAELENRLAAEGSALKANFHLAYEQVKPINLIKSTLRKVMDSQEITNNLISTGKVLTAGYLSKMLFRGVSNNPMKKLLGTALMYGIINLVAKHPEAVKSFGKGVLNLVRGIPWAGKNHLEKSNSNH